MGADLLDCEIYSVETYTGKNGLGANIVLLNNAERAKLEVNTSDEKLIQKLVKAEGTTGVVRIKLNQNKFGIRIEIVDLVA